MSGVHLVTIQEALKWGLFLFWLLAVVPAAAACGVRGRWGLFAAGFVTFGLTWFWGAATGLWRGRPDRLLRSGLALSGVLVAVLALGGFGVRPGGVLGVDAGAVATSFNGHSILFGQDGGCRSLGGGEWVCFSWDDEHSGTDASRIVVNDVGCWHQVPYGDGPVGKFEGIEGHRRGCIHLDDYV
jgi:hypothetical protein